MPGGRGEAGHGELHVASALASSVITGQEVADRHHMCSLRSAGPGPSQLHPQHTPSHAAIPCPSVDPTLTLTFAFFLVL